MASVWVAEHLTLHTQVAVKFVSLGLAGDASVLERFRREATTVAKMKNPHVVQVFDHGVTPEGSPYMVMELLEGEDLGAAILRLGSLPVPDVVRVVNQTSKALGKAHSLGLVHRDIKPENLFLTDLDGEIFVKVLDFGIAKETSARSEARSMTTTGSMIGTPYYMSPEQVLSAKLVSSGADLWSLAVVAYHALTGRVPFDAETVAGVFIAIERGAFDPPSVRNPALLPSLDAWFAKSLSRDPSVRFASAKELAASFEEAAAGRSGDERHGVSVAGLPVVARLADAPAVAEKVEPVGPIVPDPPADPSVPAQTINPLVSADTFEGTAAGGAMGARKPSSKMSLAVVGGLGALTVAAGILTALVLFGGPESETTEAGLAESATWVGAVEVPEAGVDGSGVGEAMSAEDLPKAPAKPKTKPGPWEPPPGMAVPVDASKPAVTPTPPTPPPKATKERKEYGF
jgi:serine/threonine-protein kinase